MWFLALQRLNDGGFSALPVERLFLQGVNIADEQDSKERNHRAENQIRVLLQHLPINHRPRIEENYLDIEENEQHRDEIESDRKAGVSLADRRHAAFVRSILGFTDLFQPVFVGPLPDQNRQ